MENIQFVIDVEMRSYDELSESDRMLIDAAKEATSRSYAPYSHFFVGASALLSNGKIITGINQENAAFPSGLCAERTAIFYANSEYPNAAVKSMAVACRDQQDFIERPSAPCGACRQVLLETEKRYGKPMRVLLFSKKGIYIFKSVTDLLPFSFTNDYFKK